MTSTTISNLFEFNLLPLEAKIQFMKNVPETEFNTLCNLPELRYLCVDYPNAERVYEERTRKFYADDFIKFRGNMSWKEFYTRLSRLISFYTVERYNLSRAIMFYTINNDLLELSIIGSLNPSLLIPKYANIAAQFGNLELLNLFERYGIYPTQSGVYAAINANQIAVLDWLEKRNLIPDDIVLNLNPNISPQIEDWLASRYLI